MSANDEQTCGKGLAEHSALPARMGQLIAALADNLEAHLPTLDLDDANAVAERDVYVRLAHDCREIARQLKETATFMAARRDLPMARHVETALIAPEILHAFENFMNRESELLALLEQSVQREGSMLAQMHDFRG